MTSVGRLGLLKPAAFLTFILNWQSSPSLTSFITTEFSFGPISIISSHGPLPVFFSITYAVIFEPPSSSGFFQDNVTDSLSTASTFGWSVVDDTAKYFQN